MNSIGAAILLIGAANGTSLMPAARGACRSYRRRSELRFSIRVARIHDGPGAATRGTFTSEARGVDGLRRSPRLRDEPPWAAPR
jgi:hypothetical protein